MLSLLRDIQLIVVSIDTLAELLSSVASEVLLDLGSCLDRFVELKHALVLLFHGLHCFSEHELQSVDTLDMCISTIKNSIDPKRRREEIITHMEQNQVRVRQTAAVQPRPLSAGLALEDPLEVTEELGQAVLDIILGSAQRLVLLILVVEAHCDGVVAVVDLVRESIERCKHQGVEPINAVHVVVVRGGRQAQARREVHEDVGGLAEDQVAVAQDGRGQDGRVADVVAHVGRVDQRQNGLGAAALLVRLQRLVRVRGAGLLEQQADVLAAAGDPGPVNELVGDAVLGGFLALGGRHGGDVGG